MAVVETYSIVWKHTVNVFPCTGMHIHVYGFPQYAKAIGQYRCHIEGATAVPQTVDGPTVRSGFFSISSLAEE